MRTEELFIGGSWVAPSGGTRLELRSPHTGHPFASTAEAHPADIDAAVAAARHAFDHGPWPQLPPADRIAAVRRLQELYGGRLEEMAAVVTSENGSPISFSLLGQSGAVPSMIEGFVLAAEALAWEDEINGVFGPATVVHEPIGVVAAITAWNVPQVIIIGKLIPALLAGCTVVVKAAPETPLDALLLAELVDEAGFPEGVVSILAGGPAAGQHLVAHPDIDMVTFTGSTAVGRQIGGVCGEQLKRVALELGGKSAAIILDDADLERTAAGLRFSSFINNGQACAAQTRILAPRSRYADAVDALAGAVGSFVVGDPMDEATEIGPLVTERQRDRVAGYVQLGQDEGARVVVGGGSVPDGGWYVPPTLFADVDNAMRVAREEIFGPVVVVIPYDDDLDAVRIANDSPYGLAGSVWTADADRGMAVARRVRTGTFGVNRYAPDPTTPFGGYKASGIGREYGAFGLHEFLEVKCVHGR
jgi:betaine-aldehyde dehydrogenase